MMKIWVDADACPGAVKDIITTAAYRKSIEAIFVANKAIALPESPLLSCVIVDKSADAADRYIAEGAVTGDLVITQDIPLAHILVHNEVMVINPRGDKFTADNIGERLSIRNLLEDVRGTGEITGGPKPFGDREKRAFAATFDRELTRLIRISKS